MFIVLSLRMLVNWYQSKKTFNRNFVIDGDWEYLPAYSLNILGSMFIPKMYDFFTVTLIHIYKYSDQRKEGTSLLSYSYNQTILVVKTDFLFVENKTWIPVSNKKKTRDIQKILVVLYLVSQG